MMKATNADVYIFAILKENCSSEDEKKSYKHKADVLLSFTIHFFFFFKQVHCWFTFHKCTVGSHRLYWTLKHCLFVKQHVKQKIVHGLNVCLVLFRTYLNAQKSKIILYYYY